MHLLRTHSYGLFLNLKHDLMHNLKSLGYPILAFFKKKKYSQQKWECRSVCNLLLTAFFSNPTKISRGDTKLSNCMPTDNLSEKFCMGLTIWSVTFRINGTPPVSGSKQAVAKQKTKLYAYTFEKFAKQWKRLFDSPCRFRSFLPQPQVRSSGFQSSEMCAREPLDCNWNIFRHNPQSSVIGHTSTYGCKFDLYLNLKALCFRNKWT